MKSLMTLVRSDYLQRTRSYAFLITLCASLAIAYTFVPEPNANYSTIRIANHVGYYNSAWFGYVTAIMTSIFLSLIGFYLVSSSVKTDIDTKVGQIVASTPISNFHYLLSKALSNFLVLLTIAIVVFIMSIVLFVLYNDGYPFEWHQFVQPYVVIVLPALFCIAILAIVFEAFFGKYTIIQHIGFFFLFAVLMIFSPKREAQFSMDVFGSKIVMHQLEQTVRKVSNTPENTDLSIGYVIGNTQETKRFEFNGMDFPLTFLFSRFAWIALGIVLIFMISGLFHRFNLKERTYRPKVNSKTKKSILKNELTLSQLPIPQIHYGIYPVLKTELVLLYRKGKKGLWLLNALGMFLLITLPLEAAHQIVLPLLWFLQVGRISDISTKERTHGLHYFTLSAYKPIIRILFSQIAAAVLLLWVLASPLWVRLMISTDFNGMLAISLGAVLVVLLSVVLGILFKGKKLFEVLFFMITYANINRIPLVDYFGGFDHPRGYTLKLAIVIMILAGISVFMRKKQSIQ
ncbi:ABC transporter permease [Spongiimicrobium salis]|uniref:ABC transporter permease n=1 Tax=Spongiimicrobium salis TaxID=1667022 RepID=UPI00374D682C